MFGKIKSLLNLRNLSNRNNTLGMSTGDQVNLLVNFEDKALYIKVIGMITEVLDLIIRMRLKNRTAQMMSSLHEDDDGKEEDAPDLLQTGFNEILSIMNTIKSHQHMLKGRLGDIFLMIERDLSKVKNYQFDDIKFKRIKLEVLFNKTIIASSEEDNINNIEWQIPTDAYVIEESNEEDDDNVVVKRHKKRHLDEEEDDDDVVKRHKKRHLDDEDDDNDVVKRHKRKHLDDEDDDNVVVKRHKRKHLDDEDDDNVVVKRHKRKHLDDEDDDDVVVKRHKRKHLDEDDDDVVVKRHKRKHLDDEEDGDDVVKRKHAEDDEDLEIYLSRNKSKSYDAKYSPMKHRNDAD